MLELTNEMILENFDNASSLYFKLMPLFLTLIFVALFIIYFIKFIKEKHTRRRKIIAITIIITLLICIPMFKEIFRYNAITYSLENNSWYVETDIIEKKDVHYKKGKNDVYYIYLKKYGKVSTDNTTYNHFLEGSSVYVVIVKGPFGGTYATDQIYPTSLYIYSEENL